MTELDEQSLPSVVLTGFMATGKSTVGRALAAALDRRFADTDTVVEGRHGPIPAIFAERGEATFRLLEREVLTELLAGDDPLVVATGGGTLVDDEVAAATTRRARVFTLTADPDRILRRVAAQGVSRPLLEVDDPRSRIEQLLAARAVAYARFEQVTTADRTVDEVVDELLARLGTTRRGPRG